MIRLERYLRFTAYLVIYAICNYHHHRVTSVLSFAPVVSVGNQLPHPTNPFLWTTTTNNNDYYYYYAENPETNRDFLNATFHWEYGCMSCAGTDPDRPTKVNQDGSFFLPPTTMLSVVLPTPILPQQQYSITFFGVMDGHGKKGHEVVQFLQQQLPMRLRQYVENTLQSAATSNPRDVDHRNYHMTSIINGAKTTHGNKSFSLDEQKKVLISVGHADPSELYHSDTMDNDIHNHHVEMAIVDAFVHAQYDLRQNPNVPSSRSGTTCACCILVEDKQRQQLTLYTANVGDSRVIAITCINDTIWNVQSLTNSTTVNLQMERNRIESCGNNSRIDTSGNVFYGPIGIAMTRSFGNSVMLRAGIVPVPIITKQKLLLSPSSSDASDDFEKVRHSISYYICSGTDGIFDVLSNENVSCMIQLGTTERRSCHEMATTICHAAKLAWLADLPIETKVDDCTIAIFKLCPIRY